MPTIIPNQTKTKPLDWTIWNFLLKTFFWTDAQGGWWNTFFPHEKHTTKFWSNQQITSDQLKIEGMIFMGDVVLLSSWKTHFLKTWQEEKNARKKEVEVTAEVVVVVPACFPVVVDVVRSNWLVFDRWFPWMWATHGQGKYAVFSFLGIVKVKKGMKKRRSRATKTKRERGPKKGIIIYTV